MMKIKLSCLVLILQFVVISMPVFAALDYVTYVSQTNEGTGYYAVNGSNVVGQTFVTPANCTYIDYVELMIDYNSWSTSEPLTLTLYTSTAGTTKVSQATLYGSNAGLYPKFYLKTTVSPNTTYYMELNHGGGGDNSVGWVVASSTNSYSSGCAYTGSPTLIPQTTHDLYFKIWGYQNDFLITAFYPPTPATYTTATQYDYMRDANFNCVQICEAKDQTENNTILNLCASRGIMVQNNDYNYYGEDPQQLAPAIIRYKDYSANGGFFVIDEPSAAIFADCASAYNTVLAAVPSKIPHVNLFPCHTSADIGVAPVNCLSQTNWSTSSGYTLVHNSNVAGQGFDTPADCTYISYVELLVDSGNWSASEPLTLTLYTSTARTTKVSQATLYGSNNGNYPKFYLETSVNPSASYYMELSHGGGGDNSMGWVYISTSNQYGNGCAYTGNTTLTQQLSADLYFKIYKGRSAKDKSVNQTAEGTGLPVSSTQRLGQTFKTPSTLERRLNFIELHMDQNTWSMNEKLTMTVYDSTAKHQVVSSATMPGQALNCLSQTNWSGSFGYTLVPTSNNVGQSFDTPADCTYIESVEFYVDDYYWSASEPITLTLYTSTARTTKIKSVTLNGSNGGHCPKFYLETSVNPSSSYYMELSHGGGGDNSMGWVYTSTTNPYAAGCACTSNGTTVTEHAANDLYFKIYSRPQPPVSCLSQTNRSGSFGYTLVPTSNNVGQSFDTPADCTYISYVEFYVDDYYWSTSEPITLKLYTSTARTTLIKSVTLNGSNGGHEPKFHLETSVNPSTSYYMELSHGGGGDNSMGWVYTSTTNPYAAGCACTSNGTTVTEHVGNDLYFKIYTPQSEPVYPRFYLNAGLKPDTTYFFELTHDGGGNNSVGNIRKSSSSVYSDGTAYVNGSANSGDFYFRTVYTNLYQDYVNEWVEAVGAANLKYLSFDCYPFLSGDEMQATYFLNLELVRDIGVQNNVKLAAYIQSCGYDGHRIPSTNDLRYNVYTNLAYGMKQLEWFCYFTPPGGTSAHITNALINSDGTKSNLYTPAQTLNGEVKKLGPTLVTLRSQAVYHNGIRADGTQGLPNDFWWQTGSANDNVIISYFKNHDGRKYIMAVNRSVTDSATYYFTVTPAPATVKEISKSTGAEVNTNYSSGQLSGSFLPGEGKLYALPAGY